MPPGASDTSSSLDQPQSGLVLGGGLPSIPPDLLKKVIQNDYVELSDLLYLSAFRKFPYSVTPRGRNLCLSTSLWIGSWLLPLTAMPCC